VSFSALGTDALRSMRAERRRHRVADMEWFEALYRVYLAAFLGGGAILYLSDLVGDAPLSKSALATVTTHIPHLVGLMAAISVFLGVRSGANGGPIAVEEAEVRHVLLAPVDHGVALRHPAIQRIRAFAFAGVLAGGVANQLLGRRVPTATAPILLWALWGALAGALTGILFVSAALLVHGSGLNRWAANTIGFALLVWQAGVATSRIDIPAPFDFIGSISMWWLRWRPVDVVGIMVVGLLAVLAVMLSGNLSLEALARRSALVSQLKFAVTLQDIRTVMLLRRQLSQEHMRAKPWIRVPRLLRRDVIIGRGFRSIAHFPLRRFVRMKLLTMCAAAALVEAWRGTTPAIIVAGLLLFIVGLDAIEPLSQEVDQPDRTDSFPHERGYLMTKHLLVPALLMLPFACAGVFVAFVAEPTASTIGYAFVIAVPALLGGIAGATINSVKGAPDPVGGANEGLALPPEVSGMGTVIRSAWPPAVAIISCTPVLALRHGSTTGVDMLGNTLRACGAVIILITLVAGWVRQRDAIHSWFKGAQQQARTSSSTATSTTGGN
jgi:hypothetical protein